MSNNAITNINESVLKERKFAQPERFDEHISNTISELIIIQLVVIDSFNKKMVDNGRT